MQNLVITTVLDTYGSRRWRSCGKLWVSSLLRHQWSGQVFLYRNFAQPLYPVERKELHETELGTAYAQEAGEEVGWNLARHWQTREARALISSASEFDWVLLADADCIALRNIDHLFVGSSDLLISRSEGGVDPGFVAVRGRLLERFLGELEEAGGLTVTGVSSLAQSGRWKVKDFERGEVVRPRDPGVSAIDLLNSGVVHFSGMDAKDKQRLAFALHMMAIYGDSDGLFFDIIDS